MITSRKLAEKITDSETPKKTQIKLTLSEDERRDIIRAYYHWAAMIRHKEKTPRLFKEFILTAVYQYWENGIKQVKGKKYETENH